MGLIRNFHLSRALDRFYKALEPLTEENANVKSLFVSKTFWLNVLSGAAGVLGYLPTNKYTAGGVAIANVLLRWLSTTGPVSLTGH